MLIDPWFELAHAMACLGLKLQFGIDSAILDKFWKKVKLGRQAERVITTSQIHSRWIYPNMTASSTDLFLWFLEIEVTNAASTSHLSFPGKSTLWIPEVNYFEQFRK